MKDIECAYLAGFIDADGTITINSDRGKYYPRVSISNTNKEVLDWCERIIDRPAGHVTKLPKDKNWSVAYEVRWFYNHAVYVAEQCLPYLIVKNKQAELLTTWKDCTPRNGYYTEELKTLKEQLITDIRRLNAKGRFKNNINIEIKNVIKIKAQKS